jgi:hypothetical protein
MTMTTYDNSDSIRNPNFWQRLFSRNRVVVVREASVGSVEWIEQVSEAEYIVFCNYLINEAELLLKDNPTMSNSASIRRRIRDSLKDLLRIKKADRKLLLSKSIFRINKIMEILQEYKDNDVVVPDDLLKKLSNKMYKIENSLDLYVQQLDAKKISLGTGKAPLDKWQTPDIKINVLLKNSKYDIAAIEPFTGTGKRILAVVESLEAIELGLLSIEDKYMLQEIQSSYIPNIYTSALSLKDSEGSIIEETEKDFSTQLDFVENEIKRIKDSLHKHALDTVKAQTTFALERMNEVKAITR